MMEDPASGRPVEDQVTPLGVFLVIYQLSKGNLQDYCQKMQTAKRLGLDNTQEFEAHTAFKSPIPDLFTDDGKGMYGKNESAFS